MHQTLDLKVLYFGTPVVLVTSTNPDGTPNIAPMSSAWWLGQSAVLGLADSGQTNANLHRERECVLNLAPADLVDAVDRLALTTGRPDVPPYKYGQGYRHVPDKFAAGGLTARPSELVAAPRIEQCPIQLECVLASTTPLHTDSVRATVFALDVVRAHVDESLVIPGTQHVDPVAWDPLIMKFCEFSGDGVPVHPSRLATAWQMPHGTTAVPA